VREIIAGSAPEVRFIEEYLNLLRQPQSVRLLFAGPDTIPLSSIVDDGGMVDSAMFHDVVLQACQWIADKYSADLMPIPLDRFFVTAPAKREIGGFHSRRSLGYSHFFRASLATLLRGSVAKTVRTMEAARCYLHDSAHHSTFCSFRTHHARPRRATAAKAYVPSIYREQYGFNFRNHKGISYSSSTLTSGVPRTINLNLLMDGIGVYVVAGAIAASGLQFTREDRRSGGHNVLREIAPAPDEFIAPRWGARFFHSVVVPSNKFIRHWGGDEFVRHAVHAMFTGRLVELRRFFDQRAGFDGAWEATFRRADFHLAETTSVES